MTKELLHQVVDIFSQSLNNYPRMILQNKKSFRDELKGKSSILLSLGKNALLMTRELFEMGYSYDQIIVVQPEKYVTGADILRLAENSKLFVSTHPHVTASTYEVTQKVLDHLDKLMLAGTHLHIIITGGTSASFALPEEGITLEIYNDIVKAAVKMGFPIEELNFVRSCVDSVKAGKLIMRYPDNPIITWIISDVVSDDPKIVGSAPSVPGIAATSRIDRWLESYLEKYSTLDYSELKQRLDAAKKFPRSKRMEYEVIGTRHILLDTINELLVEKGLKTVISTYSLEGDIQRCSEFILDEITKNKEKDVIIFSGEPTVDMRNIDSEGEGGRISSLLFNLAQHITDIQILILGLTTDGVDGSSPHTGYFIDSKTQSKLLDSFDIQEIINNGNTGKVLSSLGYGLEMQHTYINLLDVYIVLI